jgi:hypothetical protein
MKYIDRKWMIIKNSTSYREEQFLSTLSQASLPTGSKQGKEAAHCDFGG